MPVRETRPHHHGTIKDGKWAMAKLVGTRHECLTQPFDWQMAKVNCLLLFRVFPFYSFPSTTFASNQDEYLQQKAAAVTGPALRET